MKKIILTLTLMSTLMMAADGAALYTKNCLSCHGAMGEKKALGKSLVINKMSKDEITSALNGYKDGSYGRSMKSLMKSKVAALSDEDINALGKYISSLK